MVKFDVEVKTKSKHFFYGLCTRQVNGVDVVVVVTPIYAFVLEENGEPYSLEDTRDWLKRNKGYLGDLLDYEDIEEVKFISSFDSTYDENAEATPVVYDCAWSDLYEELKDLLQDTYKHSAMATIA